MSLKRAAGGVLEALRASSASKNQSCLDMSHPARLFPEARKMKRRVILHIGPTNSGKSYTALQAFKSAQSGYYAGPLRMLAREVYDRMTQENIPCNLVTGDEEIRHSRPDGSPALLSSGTVEMCDLKNEMEVAILDEIQMISDPMRGFAWSKAFLGVRAHQIHLCGDPNSEQIVRKLVAQTGDILEVKRYERLSPLDIEPDRITRGNLLEKLQPGDCIVCFSARKVKKLRDEIVQRGKRCAVIYGSLPPETRATQAELFNDPNSGVDYLVASDAVGMGLNLAIRRVILYEMEKFDGIEVVQLPVAQIKQIAGRAGRFKTASNLDVGSEGEGGLVTALTPANTRIIAKALKRKSPVIQRARLDPPRSAICSFVLDYDDSFTETLRRAFDYLKLSELYEKPETDNVYEVTTLIDHVQGLTLDDRIVLGNAPVRGTPMVQRAFRDYCVVIGNRMSKSIIQILGRELAELDKVTEIVRLEDIHKCITLYQWMALRYPCNLLDPETAADLKALCEDQINKRLESRRMLSKAEAPFRGKGKPFKPFGKPVGKPKPFGKPMKPFTPGKAFETRPRPSPKR